MSCISEKTVKHCSCTYTGCENHGNCCRCVAYHNDRKEVPGCFFSAEVERSYDRSLANLARDRGLL